jgi:hypothetical protein
VGQTTGRNRCGEPTCTSPVARSRMRLLHFLIASPRAPGPPPVCCATAQAQAQASSGRSETRRQVLQKRSAPVDALHGPPIQAGCGQGQEHDAGREPPTHSSDRCPPLDVAAQRPPPALPIALECMMRCGPPHQTSRRSQHASCLACTAVPSDECGGLVLASLHGSH